MSNFIIKAAAHPVMLAVLCTSCGAFAQSPGPAMPQRTALRILEQGTWGPTASSLADLQQSGFDTWFNNQVNALYNYIPDQPLLNATGTNNTNVAPLQQFFFSAALYRNYQLRQRMAFALNEIWVVSNLDLNSAAALPPILRIFQNDAFLNYRTLMYEISVNPAMGHYLDMANNNKGNPAKNTAANENYARELMQLFTLGLARLNVDGTPVLDSNGVPVPTYTQSDVTNLAKMLTGWTYSPVAGAADKTNNPINFMSPMEFHDSEHDMTAKNFLGVNIPAGNSTLQDLNQALDIIFNQPTIAPFISTQLIQHLVTSNPSPAYVSRVASVFENNGSGVRGDLKAVVYQILTDPEARAGDTQPTTSAPTFGHFREPVLFLANLLRGLNAQMNSSSSLQGYASSMGQNLFYAPSVFSYFPPNYQVDGITAPELNIYNTQNAVARTGVVNSAIFAGHLDANTTFDLTPFITAASTPGQAAFFTLVNQLFFHNDMSTQVQNAMQQAMAAVTAPADKAKAGLYIALTSAEYQVIH